MQKLKEIFSVFKLWLDADKKSKFTKILAVLFVFGVAFVGYGLINILFGDDAPPNKPSQKNAPKIEASVMEDKPVAMATSGAGSAKNILHDYILKNPFVEMSQLAKTNLPPVPTPQAVSAPVVQRPTPAPASVPLPAIPSAPVAASAMPAPAQAPSAPVTVQGILTGDDGENMAILSNGQVVSEGDSVAGDKIAFIGGNGITFDNGHSLDYK